MRERGAENVCYVKGAFVALLFLQTRRANIIALSALIFLFLVPYWDAGLIESWIQHTWH